MQGDRPGGQPEKNRRIHRLMAGIKPIGAENRTHVPLAHDKPKRAPMKLGFFRSVLIMFCALILLGVFMVDSPPEGTEDPGMYQVAKWFLIVLFAGIIVYNVYSAWKKRPVLQSPPSAQDAPAQETPDVKARSTVYTVVKCPYCGAKAKVLKGGGGLCEYCGMKVTEKEE
ncbi:MAG: hypothetical protein IJ174_07095 [Clostridia bacterium]|nr:hypothetical protein [Clostridia bacterium]